jgi:hypothetical protein
MKLKRWLPLAIAALFTAAPLGAQCTSLASCPPLVTICSVGNDCGIKNGATVHIVTQLGTNQAAAALQAEATADLSITGSTTTSLPAAQITDPRYLRGKRYALRQAGRSVNLRLAWDNVQ